MKHPVTFLFIPIIICNHNNISKLCTATTCTTQLFLSAFHQFEETFKKLNYNKSIGYDVIAKIEEIGFVDDDDLVLFSKDFALKNRTEMISTILIHDFGLKALIAHRIRAVLTEMCRSTCSIDSSMNMDDDSSDNYEDESSHDSIEQRNQNNQLNENAAGIQNNSRLKSVDGVERPPKKVAFKAVIVNDKAKRRKHQNSSDINSDSIPYNYGLPANYQQTYPVLDCELSNFYSFLIKPVATAQDPPIRPATADIYLRHAKLFLGWYIHRNKQASSQGLSIFEIVKDESRSSATLFFDYIIWLRSARGISPSYESNIIRGLTKLVKFRFEKESKSDPSYGEKSFEDIPLVREMRKYHREASKR